MLLMDIITWEPKDSWKVAELYSNYEYPKGIKVIDEWTDLTGYRTFVIYESEDEKTYAVFSASFHRAVQIRDISGHETGQVYAAGSEICRESRRKRIRR